MHDSAIMYDEIIDAEVEPKNIKTIATNFHEKI